MYTHIYIYIYIFVYIYIYTQYTYIIRTYIYIYIYYCAVVFFSPWGNMFTLYNRYRKRQNRHWNFFRSVGRAVDKSNASMGGHCGPPAKAADVKGLGNIASNRQYGQSAYNVGHDRTC